MPSLGCLAEGLKKLMSCCSRLSACVVALVLGCAGAAGAQPFSGVVVFGDSLSDSGNLALALELPAGLSLTTNPDPVAAEVVAEALGRPVLPSLAGGTNFAWIGACVNPAGPCLGATPSTAAQIAQHLSATGGQAAPDALYSLSGGANDVIAAVARGPASAAADAAAAGAAYVRQIGYLQDAGAGYVVVYNLPDLGAVPAFAAHPAAPRCRRPPACSTTRWPRGSARWAAASFPSTSSACSTSCAPSRSATT